MPHIKSIAVLSAMILNSACGGSSTSVDNQASFIELSDLADDLSIRGPESLPNSGEATFDGILKLLLENGSGYDGVMELAVDLSANSIGGTVVNFQNLDGDAIEGELIIADGEIDRDVDIENFFLFIAPLNGTLTDSGDQIGLDGLILGDLLSNGSRQMIGGVVRARYTLNGQGAFLVEGSFLGDCTGDVGTCNQELSLEPQPVDQVAVDLLNASYSEIRCSASQFQASTYPTAAPQASMVS